MYKLVVFDLDGTLLNTVEDLADACNFALSKCNLNTYSTDEYKRFLGDGVLKLIERIIPKEKRDDKLFNNVHNEYDKYYLSHMMDKTEPYDGICTVLQQLKNNNINIAVLSNKPDKYAKEMVKKYFGEVFDVVYGHRPSFKVKPNPEALNEIIKIFHINKEECIYIGDSDVDIITAKNAGVKSIGVSWGFRGRKELEQNGAAFVADTAKDLIRFIVK